MRRVTLLTDFGTRDGFVGALKGILASGAPGATVEDVAHDLPRGDVVKASRTLARYWRRYPEGTVHLVVVDPGVGTDRRGLAMEAGGRFFVAPDNGVLTRVIRDTDGWRCVDLSSSELLPPPPSRTFHGRDLFAPAAALLASGTPLPALGKGVRDPILLREPELRRSEAWVEGEVVEVDRFGNLATNLPPELVQRVGGVEVEGISVGLRGSYGEGRPGELMVVLDSEGRVEVAARNGSAAEDLGGGVGLRVRVRNA